MSIITKKNEDGSHKYVKIKCDIIQFPSLQFCGTHSKTHGVQGLRKHYNLQLYTKLVHSACEILQIICEYVTCTTIMENTWYLGVSLIKQPNYQTVV